MIKKIFFILSIVGILFLIFLVQATKETQVGIIKSIQYSNNKITIQLENNSVELVIFDDIPLNLKKGNTIKFQGKQDIYKGQEQIIVDKIFLLHHNNFA